MLVFIDESGCPGFTLDRRDDPVFVLAMIVFASRSDAAEAQRVISNLQRTIGHKSEFKFSKCRDEVRDAFFRGVSRCSFSVIAIVVEKPHVSTFRASRCDGDNYRFFVEELLRFESIQDVDLRIDGPGDPRFSRELRRSLAAALRGKVRKLQMADSARDLLIQLADMCVGAIARAYRNRPEADRWLRMLRPKIQEIRELK
jgi:hypothetical protein